jgi:hypothetical protein
MSTNAPQPFAPEIPQEVTKSVQTAAQGLAQLYMALANASPQSPIAEAVIDLQRALGEVSRNIGAPAGMPDAGMPPDMVSDPMGGAQMSPMDPGMGGAPMDMGGMPPDMGGMPPMDEAPLPPGASIEDAAGATHNMMLDAAKRRAQ